jgi:hypothetical protein
VWDDMQPVGRGWRAVGIRIARSGQPWPDSGWRERHDVRSCVRGAVKTGRRRLMGEPRLQRRAVRAEREAAAGAWAPATVMGGGVNPV